MDRLSILIDPAQPVAALTLLADFVPQLQVCAGIPIAFCDTDVPQESVAAAFGVVGVEIVSEWTMSLLAGLDEVALLAAGQPRQLPALGRAGSAVCAAVNISLAPRDDALVPTRPADSVNHATRALAEVTVPVVAAGNGHRPGAAYETLSPWAEPTWVLAVGATSDPAGTEEATYSGRGTAANPDAGPDVLAWGSSALDTNLKGTSFASARVSGMVGLARAWLLHVHAALAQQQGDDATVPLVGAAVIDRDMNDRWRPYAATAETLPALEATVDLRALRSVETALTHPRAARVLVEVAAAATRQASTTSAPAINKEALSAFLDTLGPGPLIALMSPGPDAGKIPAGAPRTPIFPDGTAGEIWRHLVVAMPIWAWEVPTSKCHVHAAIDPDREARP